MTNPASHDGEPASDDRSAGFGELRKRPAREGWTHEGHDFTPWLAGNLDRLSQALGLALTLTKREHPVGRYWCDLLLEDDHGRIVIVENQFDATDHDHLGKLLTYCAGTDAKVVVWIAEKLNEEHVAALEWLNQNTASDVGFFGVELELLRIDSSRPAPHFRVVVQPNDWTKRARSRPDTVVWDWDAYGDQLGIAEERIALGRELAERIEKYIADHGVGWKRKFNKGYVAYQRASGYNVALVDLYWNKPPRFAVKLPASLDALGLPDPYPSLTASWDDGQSEWGWTVLSEETLPDVSPALDLIRPYHSTAGPMVVPGPAATGASSETT